MFVYEFSGIVIVVSRSFGDIVLLDFYCEGDDFQIAGQKG